MDPRVELLGTTFQNPVLLAAGTCGFGAELADVMELEAVGGFVTKSVTLEPRPGNPPPRVAEAGAGMLNSVGLANPGVERVRAEKLPWIRAHLRKPRVLVSVAGHNAEEYGRIVERLDDAEGFLGFEINLSCPNDDRLGGLPFALDPEATREAIQEVRARTERPVLAKLAPNAPTLGGVVAAAAEAGADGLTLVNTLPGLALDPGTGRPTLGAGGGGLSGPPLKAPGIRAVAEARRLTELPLVGVGGILTSRDALEYMSAGASLVQVGTATFANPRVALRIARGLCRASPPEVASWPS